MMEITARNIRQWSRLGPRAVYGLALAELIGRDERVYALSADLGVSSGLGRLMAEAPERYLNVGIAEQDLIGVSAGLAKEGLVPFASSFAPFITMRCADQVRMNMGYMHLNIKTVGLSSGVSVGGLGNSHFGVDDVAPMRTVPGVVILSPADCVEVVKSVEAAAAYEGPVYIRLTGEAGTSGVHTDDIDFEIGKAISLCTGEDVTVIAAGSMVRVAVEVSGRLSDRGIGCAVLDMHTIKPLDVEAVRRAVERSRLIVTLEEHSVIGGLGTAVAQTVAGGDVRPRVMTLGTPDGYLKNGSYPYLLEQCGLTADAVTERIWDALQE